MPTETELKFGVKCKNPECGDQVVLGRYSIPTDPNSDLRRFVWTGPWKLVCPTCGGTDSYNESDLCQCQ